jgi:hypothetical protein
MNINVVNTRRHCGLYKYIKPNINLARTRLKGLFKRIHKFTFIFTYPFKQSFQKIFISNIFRYFKSK